MPTTTALTATSKFRSPKRWVLALFTLACLASYSPLLPSWSNSGVMNAATGNLSRQILQYSADFLYFWLGASAWLLLPLCFAFRSQNDFPVADFTWPRVRVWVLNGGVLLFLLSCTMLDAMGPKLLAQMLPGPSGGVLGDLLSKSLDRVVGWTLAQLITIVIWVYGLSLAMNFSWPDVAEKLGLLLESWYGSTRKRHEVLEDKQAGKVAFQTREVEVQHMRDALLEQEPVLERAQAESAVAFASTHAQATTDLSAEPAGQIDGSTQLDTSRGVTQATEPSSKSSLASSADFSARDLESMQLGSDTQAIPIPSPEGLSKPLIYIEPALQGEHYPSPVIAARQSSIFQESNLPALSLLDPVHGQVETISNEMLEYQSKLIEKKLSDFGVQVRVVAAYPGPVITRFEIQPATGVKGSQIVNLAKDLARSMSKLSIRVIETIPGKEFMALELPNPKRQMIRLSEVLGSEAYAKASSKLTMGLGKDNVGNPSVVDLAKMPHLLVAGTTGSGKSVGINAMILSLLYKATPQEVRLIMIDPKMLEMGSYEGIRHLLCPVVTDMKQAANALNWCVGEMERRYKLMSKLGVRGIAGFNSKVAEASQRGKFIPNPFSLTPDSPEPLQHLPYIVIVIDELADLMMVVGKKIEELIARLAQKARAAGMHLILATQRPSVDVITGLIKANVPTRIAFQVSSKIDSRTILDQMGAETLLGQGDMLYLAPGTGFPQRIHGAFVSDEEVARVAESLRSQGEPDYIDGILEGGTLEEEETTGGASGMGQDGEADPLYDQAVDVVLNNKRASISLVQRHLRIGYNRAARLLEQMEKSGVVSAMGISGNREILAPRRNDSQLDG